MRFKRQYLVVTKWYYPQVIHKMWIVENMCINCRNRVYKLQIMWIIKKPAFPGIFPAKKQLDGLETFIYNGNRCVATSRKGGVYVWRWHSSLKRDRDLKFTVSEQEWALPAAEKFCRQEEQKAERNYPHNSVRPHLMWPFLLTAVQEKFFRNSSCRAESKPAYEYV